MRGGDARRERKALRRVKRDDQRVSGSDARRVQRRAQALRRVHRFDERRLIRGRARHAMRRDDRVQRALGVRRHVALRAVHTERARMSKCIAQRNTRATLASRTGCEASAAATCGSVHRAAVLTRRQPFAAAPSCGPASTAALTAASIARLKEWRKTDASPAGYTARAALSAASPSPRVRSWCKRAGQGTSVASSHSTRPSDQMSAREEYTLRNTSGAWCALRRASSAHTRRTHGVGDSAARCAAHRIHLRAGGGVVRGRHARVNLL